MIVDLFAGMGGWSEGLAAHGLSDIGFEKDTAACRTRVAAGHPTIRADVATFPLDRLIGRVVGVIASPPCTDWSQSGRRQGLDGETGALVVEVDRWVRALRPRWVVCEQVPPAVEWWHRFAREWQELGYSTWAGVLNSANYGVPQTRQRAILIASLDHAVGPPPATHDRDPQPSLFGAELVPWISMASALGWTASGVTEGEPALTVCGKHMPRWNYQGQRERFRVGFPRLDDRGDSPDGYRERDWRSEDEPAFTLTEKARSWVVQTGNNSHVTSREGSKAGEGGVELYERPVTEPAPTLDTKVGGAWRVTGVNTGRDWKAGGTRDDAQVIPPDEPAPTVDATGWWHALLEPMPEWTETRPATTIQGDPRCWPPGHKINADDERRLGEDEAQARYRDRAGSEAIRLTIIDALLLQSFRSDYPVSGNKTKQFEQVGNAVPPLLAWHVLAQVVRPS